MRTPALISTASTACGPACRSVVLLVPHECVAELGARLRVRHRESRASCGAVRWAVVGAHRGIVARRPMPATLPCLPLLPWPALPDTVDYRSKRDDYPPTPTLYSDGYRYAVVNTIIIDVMVYEPRNEGCYLTALQRSRWWVLIR